MRSCAYEALNDQNRDSMRPSILLPHCSVEAIHGKHKSPANVQLLTKLVEAEVDVPPVVKGATSWSEAGMVDSCYGGIG